MNVNQGAVHADAAIHGSKAGGAAGWMHCWMVKASSTAILSNKKQAVEVVAHAMLPKAVLTLLRKRE